ncbi:MAG: efflux RND transporter periplasmic adaptor subunit [Candidatus Spyradosoma sp.]
MSKKFLITLALAGTLAVFANAEEHEHGAGCAHETHAHDDHDEAAHEAHAHDEHDGADCGGAHDHADHAHDEHAEEAGTRVEISPRVRQSLEMRFETVSDAPVSAARSYYGQMRVPAEAMKTAALPASGRVRFFVTPGQNVEPGAPLYALASPELIAMRSDLAQAEADLARARSNLAALETRLERLAQIGTKNGALESEAAFLRAEIPVLAAAAERSRGLWHAATDGAELRDGKLIVSAPFAGRIQSLDLSEGAWGERGAGALTLVASHALEFKGAAFGADAFAGTQARLAVSVGGETLRLAGTLRVEAQIDEATQARTIYFTPENLPEGVYPGQVARLEVFRRDEADEGFVAVPSGAVIKVGVDDVVFVRDPQDANAFFARKVKTRPTRRGVTPVKGVRAGETVVVKGGYELKYVLPADGNAPKKAAGHFHADGKFHEGEH